jgi:hypothetical protein
MSSDAVVLRMMRRIYDLAGGDPEVEVDSVDAGGGLGLEAERARGYASVLERIGWLACASDDSGVRLTPAGAAWAESHRPPLRHPAHV